MNTGPIDVEWSRDAAAGAWIGDRLQSFGTDTITSIVPGGFEAYARLLHPVATEPRGVHPTVRWADVAHWSGVPLTPTTQFHDIAIPPGAVSGPAPGAGSQPAEGSLCADDAAALLAGLRGDTGDQRCHFAIWEGYGWLDGGTMLTLGGGKTAASQPPSPIPAEVRHGPRLELPSRGYLLYTGPIDAALAWVASARQTPNLWWPDDAAWCVASEIDLNTTYVGGSAELIGRILADGELEALPASPGDRIQLRASAHIAALADSITAELMSGGASVRNTPRGEIRATLTRPRFLRRGQLSVEVRGPHGGRGGREYLDSQDETALLRRIRDTVERRICLELPGM